MSQTHPIVVESPPGADESWQCILLLFKGSVQFIFYARLLNCTDCTLYCIRMGLFFFLWWLVVWYSHPTPEKSSNIEKEREHFLQLKTAALNIVMRNWTPPHPTVHCHLMRAPLYCRKGTVHLYFKPIKPFCTVGSGGWKAHIFKKLSNYNQYCTTLFNISSQLFAVPKM